MNDYAVRRETMVDTQVRPSDVTKYSIIDAMLLVGREAYIPDNLREAAYIGDNIHLGNGRVVLAPRTFAKMLDALSIRPDETVLDIGCALGYSSAVIERLAEAVVAVEEEATMAAEAQSILSANGADSAAVIEGRLADGAPRHAPYDVIILQGGVEEVPAEITGQLREGGRIAALFMEGELGTVRIGYRSGGRIVWRHAFNASAPILPGFAGKPAFSL